MAKAQPNLGWLEDACTSLNEDSAYRALGSTDVKVGFAIGGVRKLVVFEAFKIGGVRDLSDARDADLIVRMSVRDWNAYLRKRKKGTGPSLLSLDLDQHVVEAANPLKKVMFERYNTSLQAFIDRGAALAG